MSNADEIARLLANQSAIRRRIARFRGCQGWIRRRMTRFRLCQVMIRRRMAGRGDGHLGAATNTQAYQLPPLHWTSLKTPARRPGGASRRKTRTLVTAVDSPADR